MGWIGPKGAIPTQLHVDGGGWADCFIAALQCYGRNAGIFPLVDDVLTQLAGIADVVRGYADSPSNPDVNLSQADQAFAHYCIKAAWTTSWQDTINAPWSIMLVNGIRLRPTNYPASWFNFADYPDHFITSLPFWQGSPNWFCDPLNPNKAYCQYDLDSVAGGFGGAYLLPSTGKGETAPLRWTAKRAFALKPLADHLSTGLVHVKAGESGNVESGTTTDKDGVEWQRAQCLQFHGWAPAEYLTIAG